MELLAREALVSAERERACIEHRAAGNDILGLLYVRNDLGERQLGAAGQTGEGH